MSGFSAHRALEHVRAIAQVPRPVGSPGHAEARQIILERLAELGLTPQVQHRSIARRAFGWIRGAEVHNILARIPGRRGPRAIMLSAHYDTVPNSPGAADDASGVAVLLEAARALQAGPPLAHDIILLFTDAEEQGLLGASAFARDHPWVKDVEVVLNFEARGFRGPSAMFETSSGNGTLIDAFAQGAKRPIASSLVARLAKVLPNDTDMTVFREAGLSGLNFALADGIFRYHTTTDIPDNLSLASLQHHGDYAVQVTRALDANPQAFSQSDDVVYFDLLSRWLIRYPKGLAPIFSGLLLALWWIVWRESQVNVRPVLMGGALATIGLLLGPVLVQVMALMVGASLGQGLHLTYARAFAPFYAALSLAPMALVAHLGITRLPPGAMALGALALATLGGVLTGLFFPLGSAFFVWPTALASCALALHHREERVARALYHGCWLGVGVLMGNLGYTMTIMDGGGAPALPALFIAGGAALWMPPLADVPARRRRLVAPTIAAVATTGIIVTSIAAHHSAEDPAYHLVHYAHNGVTRESFWLSTPGALDGWRAQFFAQGAQEEMRPEFTVLDEPLLVAPAPDRGLPSPVVDVLTESHGGGQRRLLLRITSPRQAPCVTLWKESGPRITSTRVHGEPVKSLVRFSEELDAQIAEVVFGRSRSAYKLNYCGLPAKGLEVELTTTEGPLHLRVVDASYGLGALHTWGFEERPPELRPSFASDVVYVSGEAHL